MLRTEPRPAQAALQPAEASWLATWHWSALEVHTPPAGGVFRAADGSTTLFDGLLYNRADLFELLQPSDECSAAELVWLAYQRFEDAFAGRIKGIFAVIVADVPRQRLLCARDPLGMYPLFHANVGETVLLSPDVAVLVNQPGVSRRWNTNVLLDHLAEHWRSMEETYYESVRRVPPAEVLAIDRHGLRHWRYWDPAPPGQPINWVKTDHHEQFETVLEQAVNRCLDLGPAGIFLSGGLDSVSLAAVAADGARRRGLPPPQALSLHFPDPLCDEQEIQRGVAHGLGLPQYLAPFAQAVGPRGLFAAVLDLSAALPTPLLNFWQPAYDHLAAWGRQQGCRVILTGSGGDEWLTVGPALAADLVRQGDFQGLADFVDESCRSYRLVRLAVWYELLWTSGLRLWLGERAGAMVRRFAPRAFWARRRWLLNRALPHWLAPDACVRRSFVERAEADIPPTQSDGFYLQDGRQCLRRALVTMEMEENFECGRRHGLRLMHPYWDADLVDLLFRMPPAWLHRGGRSKGLVRQALARRFPQLDFIRQKKSLALTFFNSIIAKEGQAAWQALEGVPTLAGLGLVDSAQLKAAFHEAHARDSIDFYGKYANALTLEAWLRVHS